MPDANLNDPPNDPKIGRRAASPLPPVVVPVLLVVLIAIFGYLAFGIRSSIDSIDRRTQKIENALAGLPAAETSAKDQKPAERAAAPDNNSAESKNLANSLNAIKEENAATRSQVDAIRGSITDLQKVAGTAKDATPAGFVSNEMLVAQKGLVVRTNAPGGPAPGGARTWLATPSHAMLDLLLKVPPSRSPPTLSFVPKQKNKVTSIDVYDRNSKGAVGKIANCQTENKRLRCKLNVSGPTVLQVIAKTQGDEPLDIELEPAS